MCTRSSFNVIQWRNRVGLLAVFLMHMRGAPEARPLDAYVVKDIDAQGVALASSRSWQRLPLASANGRLFVLTRTGASRSGLQGFDFEWSELVLRVWDGEAEEPTSLLEFSWPWTTGDLDCEGPQLWMSAVGDRVVFTHHDPVNGIELWVSDGTPEGTLVLRDVLPGPAWSRPYHLGSAAGHLFFSDWPGGEIWLTDWTPGGTKSLHEFLELPSALDVKQMPVQAGERWFLVANDGVHGEELWVTDAVPGGARLVLDILPGSIGSSPRALSLVGDRLYFSADDGIHGFELWASDGTPGGTVLLKDVFPGKENGANWSMRTPLGDRLLFGASPCSLWTSDGTPEGTVLVISDVCPGLSAVVGERIYFQATGGVTFGHKLWVSDGTADGTELLLNNVPGPGQIDLLTPFRDRLLFSSWDPVHGQEPWTSDGTAAGTMILADIMPGEVSSEPWSFVRLGDDLAFTASDEGGRRGLWVSDGSQAGTRRVLPGLEVPRSSAPASLTPVSDGRVIFSARDAENGNELWISDGSGEGTRLVKDIVPGSADSLPHAANADFRPLGDRIVFRVDDGLGYVYWITDGTEQGTVPFEGDLPPRPGSEVPQWLADQFPTTYCGFEPRVVINSAVVQLGQRFLFRGHDSLHGAELWVTDGTPESSVLLVDIQPGERSSDPSDFAIDGNMVLFSADNGEHGRELWATDGTAGGTRLFCDVRPGPVSSFPESLAVSGDLLFFSALGPAIGRELWAVSVHQVPEPRFVRGNVNGDGVLDISDAIGVLTFLFLRDPAPGCIDAADANDSGVVDLSDAVYTLGYLFLGTTPPPMPHLSCGADPTPDALGCTVQPTHCN